MAEGAFTVTNLVEIISRDYLVLSPKTLICMPENGVEQNPRKYTLACIHDSLLSCFTWLVSLYNLIISQMNS